MKELYDFKLHFDEGYLQYVKDHVASMLVYDEAFAPVGEHLLLLAKGGKRLRPFIFNLGLGLCTNGQHDVANKNDDIFLYNELQYALEFFQLFALIHDDIIDESHLRHGVDTLHVRFGLSTALLVGNQCLIWAMQSLFKNENLTRAESILFTKMAEETNIGQMIDSTLSKRPNVTLDLIRTSIELKTAKYTFVYPALLGLSCAAETAKYYQESLETLQPICLLLGTAFQRLDDLADILQDEAGLGKKPCGDVTKDIPTHISHYFDTHATQTQQEIYFVYRGQPLDAFDVTRVREILLVSGAIDHEIKEIERLLDECTTLIHVATSTIENKNSWLKMITWFREKLKQLPNIR